MDMSDPGAERAVLAGLFTYGIDAYIEVSEIVNYQTFGTQNNQIIYKCIEKVLQSEAEVDLPAILAAAEQLNFSDVINTKQELEYIHSLMQFPVKRSNVIKFATQIKKFEFARQIKAIAEAIARDVSDIKGDETIDEIIALMEDPLTEFLQNDSLAQRPEQLGDGIEEYLEFLMANRVDQIGIPTGFPRYDAAIGGGLRRKCVDLISARPKVGKSVFADNAGVNIARGGIKVLMLDTEMSKVDHLNRIIAMLSGVPINEVATGKFVEDEEKTLAVNRACVEIKSLPYTYVSVAGAPFENILNTIKRWIIQEVGKDDNGVTNPCVVIYDYLKLMSAGSISNHVQEYQALGFQITALHNLAVKYDFPCLSFVQLNRDGITKESTDAVSGSDRLIWLCTSFSIFKVKSPEEVANDGPSAGNRKLVPIVSRHGPGMEDGNYINVNMVGERATLIELRTRDEFAESRASGGAIAGAEVPFDTDDQPNDIPEAWRADDELWTDEEDDET